MGCELHPDARRPSAGAVRTGWRGVLQSAHIGTVRAEGHVDSAVIAANCELVHFAANSFARARSRSHKIEFIRPSASSFAEARSLGGPTRSRYARCGAGSQEGEPLRPMASLYAQRRTRSPMDERAPPIVCMGWSDGELAPPTLSELVRWRACIARCGARSADCVRARPAGEPVRPTASRFPRWRMGVPRR